MTTPFDESTRSARRRLVLRAVVLPALLLAGTKTACTHSLYCPTRSNVHGPAALASGDEDRDGLRDSDENALAARFAPVVVLHRGDANRPASIPWLTARTDLWKRPAHPAALAGVAPSMPSNERRIPDSARGGSSDPRDWTTYVHVFPHEDGGTNVQYWFFYPYNDGPLFFDHESDWEHVTVRLDRDGRPLGAYLARHENDHPGAFLSWSSLRRSGEHPVVLSAAGTHATYANVAEAAWFEATPSCENIDDCAHVVWRTWQGGGLENIGERAYPFGLHDALFYRERWGLTGPLPGTSAPFGPFFHRGFCVQGVRGCTAEVATRALPATAEGMNRIVRADAPAPPARR